MKLHDFATAPNPRKVRIYLAEKGIAEVAEDAGESLARGLGALNEIIGEHAFVAGDRVTIADCTLYAGLRYGVDHDARLDLDSYRNVLRWYEQFGQRPSVRT